VTAAMESKATKPSRIAETFVRLAGENRAAIMPFVTAGYPDLAMTGQLIEALTAAGADLIEIGVPFSDPIADGPTVQVASQKALENGTTLGDCFELVRQARAKGIDIPLLLMGYANPFYQYGAERLAAIAEEIGIDGFIIPDLPVEESHEFQEPLQRHGRDLIFFLAPTSTPARIDAVAAIATGFIYSVALTGVTGARATMSDTLPEYMKRVRARTKTPLVIGFGISTPEHVAHAATLADGVVVASALINRMDSLPSDQKVAGAAEFLKPLAAATYRAISPATGGES
jgi:tryptophan synthase alpha chain